MNIEEQKLYSQIFSILIEKKKKEKKKKKKGVPSAYNKPRRIKKGEPGYGKKKFVVHARNKDGKTKVIRFGDANLEIKRDSKERRDSFRARHNCENAKDILTARYWSCKQWRKKSKVMDSKVFDPKSGKIITESVVVYEYIFENQQFENRIKEYSKRYTNLKDVYLHLLEDLKDEHGGEQNFPEYEQLLAAINGSNTVLDLMPYKDQMSEISNRIDFGNPITKGAKDERFKSFKL
jgi:hypothetical protein